MIDINKFIVAASIVMHQYAVAFDATPPESFVSGLPPIPPGTFQVVPKHSLSKEARDFVNSDARPGDISSRVIRAKKNRSTSPYIESAGTAERVRVVSESISRVYLGADALARTKVKLVDLGQSKLNRATLIGYFPDGNMLGGPWYSMARIMRDADGRMLMLTEWDFKAAGGGILAFAESLNQKVGGSQATLALVLASNGMALWRLDWVKGNKNYILEIEDVIRTDADKKRGMDSIMDIANSLPI